MPQTLREMSALKRDYAADLKRNLLRGMPPAVVSTVNTPRTIFRLLTTFAGPAAWFALGWLVHMLWGVR